MFRSPDSFPRAGRLGRRESVAPYRRGRVRYPEIDVDRFEELGVLEGAHDPLHLAVTRLDDPWIQLALDREREGGRRDQTDENQEEFHLAPLRPKPRAPPPRSPPAPGHARARAHTRTNTAPRNRYRSPVPATIVLHLGLFER